MDATQAILRTLREAHPQGFAAMARGICPHSFSLRDPMRGKCKDWDGCFEPPFCDACWRAALETADEEKEGEKC